MMSEHPRFSVVIPTLGRSESLRNTLESVRACDPQPHEVIVVDGERTSSDPPEETWPGVKVVGSERGLTRQRNNGMRVASGDVVVFLDDDVEVQTDTFRLLCDAYLDDGVVGATGRVIEPTAGRRFTKEGRIRRYLFGGGHEGGFTRFGYPRRVIDANEAQAIQFMQGCFMSARLDVAREVGFDETMPGYALAEDEDFSYRLSRRGEIRYDPRIVVVHKNMGFLSKDQRRFGRDVVVNRTYLFRKNFERNLLARVQFCLFIGMLFVHRAVNREWAGMRGLFEGALQAWRDRARVSRSGAPTTRVTFVSSHARLGGSEVYLETLLAALDASAISGVIVLEEGPLVARLEAKGFNVSVIQTSGSPVDMARSAVRLGRLIKMQRPDVVHANGVKAAAMMTLAGPLARRPFVWVKHDFSWDGWLGSLVARRAACVVGVSDAVLEGLTAAARSRSSVIPNATSFQPLPRDEARARLEKEVGVDHPLVGLVGRFHPVKGHLELVEAAPDILEQMPQTRFVLFGGEDSSFPDQREIIVRRIQELGVTESFSFLGHRPDLGELLAGLDVGVIPSVVLERGGREGSPFALLEMMLAGVPVVGYDHGGVPEVMGPDGGVLVPPGDRVALADAVVRLLRDDRGRETLARAGRERISDRFSVERMTEGMSQIYASCRDLH